MLNIALHQQRQQEWVEPTLKENKRLLASVKVLEEELAELKDLQGRTQTLMERLAKRADTVKVKVTDVSNQQASVDTQLALVSKESNGKTLSLVAYRPVFAATITALLL